MIRPIAFGNAETTQAPQAAPVEVQPMQEQPVAPQPVQDTFTPAKPEEALQADPNDKFVKSEEPAKSEEKED